MYASMSSFIVMCILWAGYTSKTFLIKFLQKLKLDTLLGKKYIYGLISCNGYLKGMKCNDELIHYNVSLEDTVYSNVNRNYSKFMLDKISIYG